MTSTHLGNGMARGLTGRNGAVAPEHAQGQAPQMARMPWFPRDFASATRTWPLAARGAYRELLDIQWDEGSLPANPADLCAAVRAKPAEWRGAWSYLEAKFPIGPDGRRRNARLESHRAEALTLYRARVRGARMTNEGRRRGHE